jgi:hypothetical protein
MATWRVSESLEKKTRGKGARKLKSVPKPNRKMFRKRLLQR